MCGIAATFAYGESAPPVDRDELLRMRDQMTSRGPDGAGEWFSDDGRVGLGHRRLSIIDLSPTGAQPMFNADRSLAIVFNGEIYNYSELRSELSASGSLEPPARRGKGLATDDHEGFRGHSFQSNSDTEVLLHLYATHGEAMMNKLRGMYAFAIWDARKQGIFVARDPFGIKPLYYSDNGHTFRLASQVKAFRAGGKIDLAPDPAGHVGFFLWGHVPDPYTMFKKIRSLPAGSSMWVDRSGPKSPRTFCNISTILADAERGAGSMEQGAASAEEGGGSSELHAPSSLLLRSALAETVKYHLVADVPVGVFLSSGLDSTSIAALAAEQGGNLRTVTLGFEEYKGTEADETPLAEEFAKRCGATHQTVWVSRADFEAERDHLFASMDRPSIDGVNTFFVSLATKQAGLKVALSGVGGDELFGSYPSFREIPRTVRYLSAFHQIPTFSAGVRLLSAPLLKRLTSPKYAGILEYGTSYGGAYLLRRGLFMPWELPALLDPEILREGWAELQTLLRVEESLDDIQNSRLKVSALELQWYMRHQLLRDSDWAGMAHSVEIRVPFVDVDFLKQLAPMLSRPDAPSKRDMAQAALSQLPASGSELRASLLDRRKTGFQVPVRDWLMAEAPSSQLRSASSDNRGLRGWAKHVYRQFGGTLLVDGRQRTVIKGRRTEASSELQAPSSAIPAAKRILVYRIGQIGDTIVALPAMRAVRAHFPDAHIELLCDLHAQSHYVVAADILKPTSLFNGFITYGVNRQRSQRRSQLSELTPILRRKQFDTLIYLVPSQRKRRQITRDWIFFRMIGIKHFFGFHNFPVLPPKQPGKPLPAVASEGDLLLDRLAADGIKIPSPKERLLDLNLTAHDDQQVDHWLASCPSDGGRRWIGVGPGCKQPVNRWPIENYSAVLAELVERFDVWPVIFGGREDLEAGEFLLQRAGRGYNAAGKLDVRTTATAMRRCTLFVGNDTGTMHIASTAGIPCVGIYSARQWRGLWEPYTPVKRILRSEIECEGCGLSECIVRKMECITRITPQMVVEACAEFLESGICRHYDKLARNRSGSMVQ